MEIDCGINCFSPELNGSLRVNQDRPSLFSDIADHSFRNTVLMVSVWRAWLVCSTTGHEDIPEGLIVIFSPPIIAPESLDLVSH
jgi:hypothetical protein